MTLIQENRDYYFPTMAEMILDGEDGPMPQEEVVGMILAMVDAMPEGFHKTLIENMNKEYK